MSLLAGLSQQGDSIAVHNASAAAHLNIVRRTLSGNLVLTAADLPQQKIIPDADRDVTLPAESTAQWMFTTMCKENNMPIYVFNMDEYGNLNKVVKGEKIGTLVKI